MSNTTIQVLPDLLAFCPFEGGVNPHYKTVCIESTAWMNSYNVFLGDKRSIYEQILPELLMSHIYPYADLDAFRLCCYYIHVAYAFEELSDDLDGAGVQGVGNALVSALAGEGCDGSVMSVISKDFMNRFGAYFSPTLKARFVAHNKDYIDSVVYEADLRARGITLNESNYRDLRRINGAVIIFFDLVEVVLGIELPNAVHEDPILQQVYMAALDTIVFCNDLLSYKMECTRGLTECNLVTVLMRDYDISLQQATDRIGSTCEQLVQRMVEGKSTIRSFGVNVDVQVQAFIRGLEQMVVGNINWSFATKRYFGEEGNRVKEGRVVVIPEVQLLVTAAA